MISGIKVSRLTPPGRGAVAVLQVDVDDATDANAIDRCFVAKNGIRTADANVNRILYGDWGPEDVVVVRTGPRQWEINCHGGEVAAGRIAMDLVGDTAVATESSPSDFTQRLQQELLNELLNCRSQQTVRYLLAQQQGVLSDFLNRLATAESWDHVSDDVRRCLSWQRFTDHLTTPWQIAIFGQPNAGKSSLLNAILGYDRSIVFDQPGTTRDRVESDIVLAGWPFRLTDTAGIRDETISEIETVGVAAARQSLQESDACWLVVDSVAGWTDSDTALLNCVPPGCPCLVLMNKSDLVDDISCVLTDLLTDLPNEVDVIHTSTVNGSGLTELSHWLPAQLVPAQPPLDVPLPVVGMITELLQACCQQNSLAPLSLVSKVAEGREPSGFAAPDGLRRSAK